MKALAQVRYEVALAKAEASGDREKAHLRAEEEA